MPTLYGTTLQPLRLRDRKGRAILCIAFNPQSGDFSDAILEVPFKALLHGRRSEFSRWSRERYKRGKRNGNLNKSTFLSFGVLRFILGSSLVRPWSFTREE